PTKYQGNERRALRTSSFASIAVKHTPDMADPSIANQDNSTSPMIDVFSPEGVKGKIPVGQESDFFSKGFKPAVRVTTPEGVGGWLPSDLVHDYLTTNGFKLGPPEQQNIPGDSSAAVKIARGTALGIAGSALPETQTPVQDLVKGVTGYNAVKDQISQAAEAARTGHPVKSYLHASL